MDGDKGDKAAVQRIGPLAYAASLLSEHGCRIEDALAGLEIGPDDLSSPDNFIPFHETIRFLDRCAEIASIPHFALLLGSRSGLATIGAAGSLMAASPTLREALISFVSVQPGYSSGAAVYITSLGDDWMLGYSTYAPHPNSSYQIYDLVMAVACNVIDELTGGLARPTEVLVCRNLPDDRRPYDAFFKAPLRFNQPQAGLIFHKRALDITIKTANAAQRERMMEGLRLARPDIDSLSAKLRHMLAPMLLVNRGKRDELAGMLGMSASAMRRQLADEGTTFSVLRDTVRQGLALELLRLTDMPINDVAAAVAFEHHSTFTRAVRRWTGQSPVEIRQVRRQRSTLNSTDFNE